VPLHFLALADVFCAWDVDDKTDSLVDLSSLDFRTVELLSSFNFFLSSIGFSTKVVASLDLATSFAGIIFPRCRLPSLKSPTNLSMIGIN